MRLAWMQVDGERYFTLPQAAKEQPYFNVEQLRFYVGTGRLRVSNPRYNMGHEALTLSFPNLRRYISGTAMKEFLAGWREELGGLEPTPRNMMLHASRLHQKTLEDLRKKYRKEKFVVVGGGKRSLE